MNKIEITELPNNKLAVWFNGKNIELNNDIAVGKIIKILHNCIHYLYSKL